MVIRAHDSPSSSPVRITVSSAGGFRNVGLTSPVQRTSISNSPLSGGEIRRLSGGRRASGVGGSGGGGGGRYLSMSKDGADEYVAYTVHIPPTPEHQFMSSSEISPEYVKNHGNPNENRIKDTVFTGGFNSETRAHARRMKSVEEMTVVKSKLLCQVDGCDEKLVDKSSKSQCECGFRICNECYLDYCSSGGGVCPGCKEPFREACEEDDGDYQPAMSEEKKDTVNPLPRRGGGIRLENNFSLVRSFKAPNQDFDHTRWLFETNGTYGFGNAVWPREECHRGGGGLDQYESPPMFNDRRNRPLTRKVGISAAILSPYRLLIVLRLVALALFLTWRIMHPNHEAIWLWLMSVICEVWFAFSWILDQLPKLCPVTRSTDLSVLKERFEPTRNNPKGLSDLPGIDIFVSTADAEKEPPLVTANTILSILAVDYPVDKLACYLSDDGGSLVTFEALAEAASFAGTWVPFCRKHEIEPRNPEAYFSQKGDPLKNKRRVDFVRERRRVKREYDEFKVRINALPELIRRRSDACNAREELLAKKKQMELGGTLSESVKVPKATWMSDGNTWHGTWFSGEEDHSRGNHAGIIQLMLVPPAPECTYKTEEDPEDLIDTRNVDTRLPMLVYVSREKRPGFDHNKKAGAMNAMVRASAIMSNGSFILNLDCDHYIYNSLALREGMCFMLDRGGDKISYVQFPQRFEGIDPSDRYANHNTVFFDVSMRALDGLQGPMYVGTGCIFRRIALYGFSPPRATEHRGWFGGQKIKFSLRRMKKNKTETEEDAEMIMPIVDDQNNDEEDELKQALIPERFGDSTYLIDSIAVAEFGGRLIHELRGKGSHGRPSGSLAVQREPIDRAAIEEAIKVVTCFYEDKTEWGKRVGWIYGSITEDVVTGYRMHNRGWRSVYCVTKRDAFRGTAPINLTDRLIQVLRWATGSVEIFFSRNNALFASPRMKFLQRIAYFNVGMYPFTSIFLLAYCVLPALSLFSGKFIVQSLNVTFLILLLAITVTLSMLALLEIRWSKITLHDWWRNEQFWLIGGTSAHPVAVIQGLLKVIAGIDISFTLTSKPAAADDGEDEFAELYEFRFTMLMIPPVTIILLNVAAIAVGVFRTMYSPFPEWSKLVGGVFFSFWVLSHLYPFAKGLMGRKGKISTIVYLWSMLICIVISLIFLYIHPPDGSRVTVGLQFP
ncbi:Cellulose synthase [Cynara cardunculus var. scolymus]|uniref:Cellulose synthase n=1 Tax=Cynara cardunculus var. scolymus TaxID=59895 RepID=A0A103XPU9_CYNCS|nr:Cellulose synthase [Cynara cardunculus var. scolymus]